MRRSGRPICDLSCKAYSKISGVKEMEVICKEMGERIYSILSICFLSVLA